MNKVTLRVTRLQMTSEFHLPIFQPELIRYVHPKKLCLEKKKKSRNKAPVRRIPLPPILLKQIQERSAALLVKPRRLLKRPLKERHRKCALRKLPPRPSRATSRLGFGHILFPKDGGGLPCRETPVRTGLKQSGNCFPTRVWSNIIGSRLGCLGVQSSQLGKRFHPRHTFFRLIKEPVHRKRFSH